MKFNRITIATFTTKNLLINLLMSFFSTISAANLTGAGATFPAPVYTAWADVYQKKTGNQINYQSIGSSGGVKQIKANTIDFGASDIPLSNPILNKENLFQFPTVIGGIVLVINLPEINKSTKIILDGKILGDIYLGKIKKWNDKEIVNLNSGLKLPSKNIVVIRRADSSGTSFVFTKYLTKVNKEWRYKVGFSPNVNWPIGLGGKGNDGVSAFVQRLPGSIGYVEYAYAKQNSMSYTKLISAIGKPVNPTEESFLNAAKNANWDKSLAQDLTNQKGENVWPITSTTFILLHKKVKKPDQNIEVLNFFDWAYKHGRKQVSDLNYANLPQNVVKKIRSVWNCNYKF